MAPMAGGRSVIKEWRELGESRLYCSYLQPSPARPAGYGAHHYSECRAGWACLALQTGMRRESARPLAR